MDQLKDLFIPVSVCLLIAYATSSYLQRFAAWKRIGIKGEPLYPFFTIIKSLWRHRRPIVYHEMAQKYGKVFGLFFMGGTQIMVCDPEVVIEICVKNFDKFTNHGTNPFTNKFERSGLVWRKDEHWRYARSMISPAFTSKKMKKIVDLLQVCSNQLVEEVELRMVSTGSEEKTFKLNLKETFTEYALDGITTCGYGMKLPSRLKSKVSAEAESSTHDKSRDDLIRICTQIMNVPFVRYFALVLVPKKLLAKLDFDMIPESSYYPLVEQLEKRLEIRRRSPRQQEDLMQSIMDVKYGDKSESDELDKAEAHHVGTCEADSNISQESQNYKMEARNFTDFEIVADLAFFMSAGLHTTSVLMTNCLYALANHPEVQGKLHEEIKKIATPTNSSTGYSISYDDLITNLYLDACMSEILRLFTPALMSDRVANEDFYLPKYNARIHKGSSIILGIYALHHDPDNWPDPEKFDPLRFFPENRHKIVPGSYIPFGFGPRHCVGMRFALTEAKMGIAKMVLNFMFEPAPDVKYPPEFAFNRGILNLKDPHVVVRKR